MASPSYARSLTSLTKRLKLSPPTSTPLCWTQSLSPMTVSPVCVHQRRYDSTQSISETSKQLDHVAGAAQTPTSTPGQMTATQELASIRLPRAVQATYLDPLRHKPEAGAMKMCELQIRSYSVRNLEVFTDFVMRAAYYLKLPVKGPTSLPKITERWTVPRSNFVHKKSQENFERITVRRSIAVYDAHPETVAAWLAFIKKRQYYGVGMKANVWDYSGVEVAKDMDAEAEQIAAKLGEELELVGGRRGLMQREDKVQNMVLSEPFKAQWGAYEAMGGAQSVPSVGKRMQTKTIV